MNMRLFSLILSPLLFIITSQLPANAQMIVLEDVPLRDAIWNLARQADMKLILDPVLTGSAPDADGKYYRAPSVSKRLENVTARAALEQILADHKLVLIENPVTTVYRITFANRGTKPVPASQVIGNTNNVIPLLLMDEVPLNEALNQLARQAGLKIALDPKVLGAPATPGARPPTLPPRVSFRWENISGAQALAAVLDAYDLKLVKPATGDQYEVSPKAMTESQPGSPEKPKAPSK